MRGTWGGGSSGAGVGRGADLPSLQCVDAPRAPASQSLAGACTVRPAGPHPAGRLAQAPPHLSPLWAGRTPAPLPAGAPVLASHLSSVAFSLEQPRPSPECALPRLSPRPGSEPAGLLQGVREGVPPYPRPSRLGELGSPTRPPLHSTAGTGAAEPGSSCLLFRVGWQRPGGPVGRVRVGEPRVGPASSGRPPFSGVPAPSEREPSALGEAGHSWRSPGQQVFLFAT